MYVRVSGKGGKKVNLIALPDEWANYKGILQSFRDKYPGVENPVASPDISSQEELDAINNLKGQADMPDKIDVSPAKAADAITQGLWEPYKPSSWDQIPDNLKDPANSWIAAYYGVMAITTNTSIVKEVPKTWADLKDPKYKGQVALNGDHHADGHPGFSPAVDIKITKRNFVIRHRQRLSNVEDREIRKRLRGKNG